ncbi:MAG TPA: hypothetical protein PK014_05490 [Thermoanaerobaculia bacterium]|nr:hypothetical protein [Thermoanaerobaculia bacterium]HXK68028.1 hypothetical protein [Thermoanaerobaculia bacterium]
MAKVKFAPCVVVPEMYDMGHDVSSNVTGFVIRRVTAIGSPSRSMAEMFQRYEVWFTYP